MPFLIIGAILAILVYVPSYWVRHVMRKNGEEVEEIAGTGGELAQHLIDRFPVSYTHLTLPTTPYV